MLIEKITTSKTVLLHEADMFAKASIPFVLNYLIEAAREHAQILGFGSEHLQDERLFWVLSRMKVEILKYPRWREKVKIVTWPRDTDGVYAYRDFYIQNENDDIYIKATGGWLVVDIETRKIKRLNDFFKGYEFIQDKTLNNDATRLKFTGKKENFISIPVYFSDIDFNGHINSARYLQKIIDTISIDQFNKQKIKGFEINYNKEGGLQDSIKIYSTFTNTIESEYLMISEKTGNELCIAKLYWE